MSFPVESSDFVEVYFYARIEAEGDIPGIPPGFQEYAKSSSASATAVLEYASIIASM